MSAAAVLAPIYVGPATIACPQRCEVPEGCTAFELPPARHAWPGVYLCPNGCGRTLALSVNPGRLDDE